MARGRKKQPDKIDEAMASITPNLTKETFTEHFIKLKAAKGEVKEAASALADARAVLKGGYKRAEADGIDPKDMKWALEQDALDNDLRESSHRRRMTYMEFLGKPLGTQVSFDFAGAPGKGEEPENQPETMTELQRHRIIDAGKSAGGMRADSNPWVPGTYAHSLWAEGWQGAQAEMASKLGAEEDAIA